MKATDVVTLMNDCVFVAESKGRLSLTDRSLDSEARELSKEFRKLGRRYEKSGLELDALRAFTLAILFELEAPHIRWADVEDMRVKTLMLLTSIMNQRAAGYANKDNSKKRQHANNYADAAQDAFLAAEEKKYRGK